MFSNRKEAGHILAKLLQSYKGAPNVIVLGLARGGAVIASVIAKDLNLLFNVIVPRKVGAPGNPELALGAIMEDGSGFFNERIIQSLNVSETYLKNVIEQEIGIAKKRLTLYQHYCPMPDLKNMTVILTDDGIATGATLLAAIQAMRNIPVKKIIAAVPIAASDSLGKIEEAVDEIVCPYSSEDFFGVGQYYKDFSQIEDSEIIELLKRGDHG